MKAREHPICFLRPARLTPYSAWYRHIPFAMFLVELLKPGLIVELGAYYGDSYCAFCQAVKHLGLPTRCYAVDLWQGDPHAGVYPSDVLADLRAHHDSRYGSFSTLLQREFDDAARSFGEGTIDLLHVDGYHTYEAVTHDFEAWRPRMSARGIVLFHDIDVRGREFGVWKLWQEVSARYPHFAFTHGHGLGVLGVGRSQSPGLQELFGASEHEATEIRRFFSELGARLHTPRPIRNLKKRWMKLRQFLRRPRRAPVSEGPEASA